jgi:glycosyltransferase involved in cell wall biosynthesis
MRILIRAKNYGGVEYHRLYIPLKRMQIDFEDVDIFTAESLPEDMNYDLVVFSRYLYKDHYPTITKLKELSIPYILDIDDFWRLPKFHYAAKAYKEQDITNAIKDAITYAAGVTVTTDKLAAEVRPLNHNVCVLPNAIEWTDDQWAHQKETRTKDKTRFGWVGGISHENDLHLITDAVNTILNKYPNVEFHLCGVAPHELIWQRICRHFEDRVIIHTGRPVNEYGAFYSLFDVMLVPLENSKYNNMKSELKVIEAAEYKLPVIASNVSPYKELEGNYGLTLVEPNEWLQTMEMFVLSDRTIDGEHNYKYCRENYDIEKINEKRKGFYNRICKSTTNARG